MTNEQLGSRSVDFTTPPEQVEDDKRTTTASCYFCNWIVAVYEFCTSIKQKYNNWQTRKAHIKSYNQWSKETYNTPLHEYNISDVFVAASGENNKLGQGVFGRVDRYQITGDDNQPDEIAYKYPDISRALQIPIYAMKGEAKLNKTAQECLDSEKEIISKLSHPNIISPVLIDGKKEFAKNKTVITTRTLSEEEKNSLKEHISPAHNLPDFDFEIIESVTTKPGGIPLPLADTTLGAQLSENSLTVVQKDRAVRGLTAAVGYMHKNGYCHLDIKPANILRKGDEWLLADFGISYHYSALDRGSEDSMPLVITTKSSINIIFGSKNYVSPQMQARFLLLKSEPRIRSSYASDLSKGKDTPPFNTDARHTDAYSLGITLFEILTGVNPTPDKKIKKFFKGKEFDAIPTLYQNHVDELLKQHREAIGNYYEVVAGLLKSDCSQRMTVPEAEDLLTRIAQPD